MAREEGRTRTQEVRALVERAQGGCRASWAALYARYAQDVGRVLRGALRDADDAADLTQETFEQAWASLPRFAGRSSFRGWLVGIAYNVARYHRRAHARFDQVRQHYSAFCELTAASPDPEADHARREASEAMASALEHLPDRLRVAFELRYVDGMSLAHAAEVAGVTPTNLGVRVHRAKAQMRVQLRRAGWSVGQVGAA